MVSITPNHDHLAEGRYEHDDDVIVLLAFAVKNFETATLNKFFYNTS